MNTYAEAKPQHQPQAPARTSYQQAAGAASSVQLMENRLPAGALGAFQELTNSSPRAAQLRSYQALANHATVQREAAAPACASCANKTGLPDSLKAGVEALSGMSLDNVRVHYNSSHPAQLNAHAYAQGRDIHLAPGQERHLPHEAWHIVQQAQGRVRPTMQMKHGVPVNDDAGLEHEADVMGAKALASPRLPASVPLQAGQMGDASQVQMIRIKLNHANDPIMHNVRATPVPRPGAREFDGLLTYDPAHPPIGVNENIVLEGHGTYLAQHHVEGAPYDSLAQLNPEQLANVAFLVHKPPGWHGQIILFGCATGTLSMAVSRHYLALSGQSINVVGTLADIRMELPGNGHPDHRAEYDRQGQHFPRAGNESISSRARYQRWLIGAQNGALQALQALQEYEETVVNDGGPQARTRLANSLSAPLQLFRHALATRIHYAGGVHGESDMARAVNMLQVADQEMTLLKHRLAEDADDLTDHLVGISQFLDQLMKDFDIFERQASADEGAIPEGVVDWEGQNVVNSQATESQGLAGIRIPQADLISDQWGGGVGGQLLMNVLINHDNLL